jgi:hypothetical protein
LKWPQPLQGIHSHICHARIIALAVAFIVSSAQPSARRPAESKFFDDGNAAAGFNTEAISFTLRRLLSNID